MQNYELNEQRVQPVSDESTATSSALPLESSHQAAVTAKMPYCASHQVEFLHLQAELDALLQQLQSLKQQRLAAEADSAPALAIR